MGATDLLDLVWLVPAFPLLGAVVLLFAGKRIGEPASGWIATGAMAAAFLGSVVTFAALSSLDAEERAHVTTVWTWFDAGGFRADLGFLVDPLSVTMILFVTGVGTLIHLYSIGYMHGDPRFSRFFAYLNLFAASMLVLVLGSNFLVTFLGWEGVGLCSYLLISFWFERNSAAVAGKKAFVTNRVGDFGFMLAMFLIVANLGTLDYGALDQVGTLASGTATAIALLLFVGAMGKSAQVPLHVWLPDAMEGPTPVSALIHAATMVTAGVFLVSRAHPFFEVGASGTVVAWVGVGTALFAATVALVQNDIKRLLAYSTVSQLGFMFLAAGIGAYKFAIFHMVTHAFFKALLFLAAGSVIHGLGDEQDMRRMGGLRRYMPITFGVFIVGWLAIAGVFPFAGFWSKDEILAKAWFSGQYPLWALGLVAAVLTAFYMTRQVWLVFYGSERWRHPAPAGVDAAADADHAGDLAAGEPGPPVLPEEAPDASGVHEPAGVDLAPHGDPHESPWTMTVPLGVLAVLAALGGLLNLPFVTPVNLEYLADWLEPVFPTVETIKPTSFAAGFALATLALAVAVAGILVARALYRDGLREDGTDPGVERLGAFARVLEHGWYLDVGIARFVSGPGTRLFRFLTDGVDRSTVDGAVDGIGRLVGVAGTGLRRVQTGLVRNYALAVVAGAVLLLAYFATRVAL